MGKIAIRLDSVPQPFSPDQKQNRERNRGDRSENRRRSGVIPSQRLSRKKQSDQQRLKSTGRSYNNCAGSPSAIIGLTESLYQTFISPLAFRTRYEFGFVEKSLFEIASGKLPGPPSGSLLADRVRRGRRSASDTRQEIIINA